MRFLSTITVIALITGQASGQSSSQPKVTPGAAEPDWVAILDGFFGLSMFGDLANPVKTTLVAVPGKFQKAGPGPVIYTPIFALGLETTNRGGWYTPGNDDTSPNTKPLWSYTFKNTGNDLETGKRLPPPLAEGSTTRFDPGTSAFGVWVANDGLKDGGVFSEPKLVKAINSRLAKQPYKAMIYPNKEKATGKLVPNSYLIGWEYSTNDDFQDVVCRIDNVILVD